MINLKSFFKDKKEVPNWFKDHAIFKKVKRVNKIFPSIGLSNFTMDAKLDSGKYMAPFIKRLCIDLSNNINAFTVRCQNIKGLSNCYHIGTQLSNQLKSKQKLLIKQFSEKNGLYLQDDIIDLDKKIFAKKNESIFKVYTKYVNLISKTSSEFLSYSDSYYYPRAFESFFSFKDYSSNNLRGKLQIVFSSDGNDGAWDILTMSQRGVTSCQSWDGQYSRCLIGSVLDPHTAIIYLTSGSDTPFGSKMIRRCVVRYVINEKTGRPYLFLDIMYPGANNEIMKLFKQALKSKLKNKNILISSAKIGKCCVPYSRTTTLLMKHIKNRSDINRRGYHNHNNLLPYRDTFTFYKMKKDKILSKNKS